MITLVLQYGWQPAKGQKRKWEDLKTSKSLEKLQRTKEKLLGKGSCKWMRIIERQETVITHVF